MSEPPRAPLEGTARYVRDQLAAFLREVDPSGVAEGELEELAERRSRAPGRRRTDRLAWWWGTALLALAGGLGGALQGGELGGWCGLLGGLVLGLRVARPPWSG